MQIAAAAVAQFEPAASPWWQSGEPTTDRPALNLARRLSARGIDLDALRLGDGLPAERLTEAFQLTDTLLGARPGTIVIDHFGELLSGMTEAEIRRLLGDLRILVQRRDTAALTVVEPPDGHVSAALHDPDHPLFHAGQEFAIRRPEPERFASDMAITKPSLPPGATVPLLTAIAELAHGAPDLVWRTLELTPAGGEPAPAAAEGWSRWQEANAAALAAQWGLLRRVHPHARTVAAALAFDLAPTSSVANPRIGADALARLRAMGVTWQPQPRTSSLTDPLFAAWIRNHPPPWTRRMRRSRKSGGARARPRAGSL